MQSFFGCPTVGQPLNTPSSKRKKDDRRWVESRNALFPSSQEFHSSISSAESGLPQAGSGEIVFCQSDNVSLTSPPGPHVNTETASENTRLNNCEVETEQEEEKFVLTLPYTDDAMTAAAAKETVPVSEASDNFDVRDTDGESFGSEGAGTDLDEEDASEDGWGELRNNFSKWPSSSLIFIHFLCFRSSEKGIWTKTKKAS